MTHKPYRKIIKFTASILLVNFLLINSVSAQTPTEPTPTPPPPSRGNVVLTKDKWERAQNDEAYCKGEYKKEVSYVFANDYKAVWDPGLIFDTEGGVTQGATYCFIAPGTVSDTLPKSSQPSGSQIIEDQIRNGKGISAQQIIEAKLKDAADLNSANLASRFIGGVLNAILSVVAAVLGALVMVAGLIMDIAINNAVNINYDTIRIVDAGWSVVRDMANMFFIVILIVIALGAILRIESLDYRHLLPELIVMAILVNFSKAIAIGIIDFVGVITNVFYGGGISDIWRLVLNILRPDQFFTGSGGGWMVDLGQGIGKILFMLAALAVFLMLSLLFVVRLIGLYIFIIFSPAYFVLDILPVTKEFAHKFLHKFVEYVVWVPVAMFMIRITMLVAQKNGLQGIEGGEESFFTYIIVMGFLVATILIAEHAGMVGGMAVINGVEKAGHMALEAGDMWLARGANRKGDDWKSKARRASSWLSVGSWKQGFDQRFQHKEHESYLVAAAQKHDALNKLIAPVPGRGHETDFGLKAEQQLVADERKQIHTKNNTELIEGMKSALHGKEGEKAFAYAQALFENSDGNEALARMGYGTDHAGFQQFIDKNFVPIMGKEKAYRLAYDLSRTAEEANHWNFARAYTAEVKNGKVEYVVNPDAGAEVRSEIAKMNPQNAARTLNRLGRGFIEVDGEDGTRYNLGLDEWGRKNRQTIDSKNASDFGNTGNMNTAYNYMFNDSENTFKDNKTLWMYLANRFSNMSPEQKAQAQSIISKPGKKVKYVPLKDESGNIVKDEEGKIKYTNRDQVTGKILYADESAASKEARTFSIKQAYDFWKDNRLTDSDLANKDFDRLRSEMEKYAREELKDEAAANRLKEIK